MFHNSVKGDTDTDYYYYCCGYGDNSRVSPWNMAENLGNLERGKC